MATTEQKPPLSVADALTEFKSAGTVLGLAQAAALDLGSQIALAKSNRLTREAVRLQGRYGKDAPCVLEMQRRQATHADFMAALADERARAAVPVPDAVADAALVYGRVLDERGAPVPQAGVVALAPDGNGAAAKTGSDAKGRYQLRVPLKEAAVWQVQASASGGRQSAPSAALLSPGTRALRDLVLLPGDGRDGDGNGDGGNGKPQMPDLMGLSEARAREVLAKLGTEKVTTKAVPTGDAVGLVIRQDPAPGSDITPQTPVVLDTVKADTSTQPKTVAVPPLLEMPLEAAKTQLQTAGLVLGAIKGKVTPGSRVAAQKPSAGTQVAPGSAVDVQVRDAG
jgi:hypothetical protein